MNLDAGTAAARQPYLTLQEVDEKDLEDGFVSLKIQEGFVDDREVVAFIERYSSATEGFHDFALHTLRDIFTTRSPPVSSSTTWVENPLNGRFVAVRTSQSSSSSSAALLSSSVPRGRKDALTEKIARDDLLERVPLIPKLTEGEKGTGREKSLLIPPFPAQLRPTDEEKARNRWSRVRMEFRNFSFVKRLLFLFFQGLLAGFCAMTLFVLQTSSSSLFFSYYQPMAQEVRRYFFLLSTISLVGSIDYFITLLEFYSARNPFLEASGSELQYVLEEHQKFSIIFSLVVLALYVIVFFCTLIMSIFDVQIAYRNGGEASTWVALAQSDSLFMESYDRWIVLNNVRVFATLAAWMSCCFLLWKDFSRYNRLWVSLKRVRETALSWMKRASALEGSEELDKLSPNELQEMIKTMEFGIKRARNVLSLQQQEDFKKVP